VEQAFEPAHLSLKANVTVTVSVANTTSREHNLTVKDPEGHRVVDVKIPAGETVNIPFAPTTPGTYILYCKYALHRTFGEEGTLEVN
jgi:plastocyanin